MLTGLRGRLAALLALVSAVTIAVCAVALLGPLEKRIVDDELASMRSQARQGEPALEKAAGDPPHRSRALHHSVRRLQRLTGAEVAVVAPDGRVLASTDPSSSETFPDAVRALREGRVVRGTGGAGSESEAQLALPTEHGFAIAMRKPLDDVRGAAAVVRRAFLLAAVVSLIAAVLLGLALARRVVWRLRRLRDTALTVAELGPVAEFQPDGGRDEVSDLTRAFATMQRRLREQEAARRSFVATASHELRTPLTSLRVMLDEVRGDLAGPQADLEHARREVERADAQAERLATLAADLLDLSRIDAGLPLRSELVELTELVRSVLAEFELRAAETGRPIDLKPAEPCWAVADPGSAAQVVRILLDNALRHGAGRVSISVAARRGMAAVAVDDQGAGVPAGDRERIFERFERAGSANPGPGFGLGLAIGRELARRMGGDLALEQPDGPGARFALTLPGAPAP